MMMWVTQITRSLENISAAPLFTQAIKPYMEVLKELFNLNGALFLAMTLKKRVKTSVDQDI